MWVVDQNRYDVEVEVKIEVVHDRVCGVWVVVVRLISSHSSWVILCPWLFLILAIA